MTTFTTEDGDEVPAVTADEMREVDRVAVDSGFGILQMMENAGRTLAIHAREMLDEREMRDDADMDDVGTERVVVVAGSGGNGGGGLCAARHLDNHGIDVGVVLDREPDELGGAARRQFEVLDADVVTTSDEVDAELFVDALVGYGLEGAPEGRTRRLIEDIDGTAVSLDVPSGTDATTGETPGVYVDADRTVTLALPKTGLGAGELYLADIGIPEDVFERAGVDYATPFEGSYWVKLAATD